MLDRQQFSSVFPLARLVFRLRTQAYLTLAVATSLRKFHFEYQDRNCGLVCSSPLNPLLFDGQFAEN
jgi:hypothetical protein